MVQVLKLVTGEELLANVSDNKDTITIDNPVRVVPTGQGQMAFIPWVMSETKQFVISKSHVVAMAAPIRELEEAHAKQFGGIIVPKSII